MNAKTKAPIQPPEHDVRAELETIERLQAEARRIAAQLKEAEAALSPLDKVIAKQQSSPANIILLQRVKARVGAGQSKDEAIHDVLEASSEWLEAELDNEAN
jgi:hypothetical protein